MPVGVRRRHQCLLVAHHAQEPNLGRGQQALHALEHAETRPQDRHDKRLGLREAHTRGRRHRGLHLDRLGAHLTGCLVGEQRDQFVGQPTEGGGVGAFVAQCGQLVGDERVVDDERSHDALRLAGGRPRHPPVARSRSLRRCGHGRLRRRLRHDRRSRGRQLAGRGDAGAPRRRAVGASCTHSASSPARAARSASSRWPRTSSWPPVCSATTSGSCSQTSPAHPTGRWRRPCSTTSV